MPEESTSQAPEAPVIQSIELRIEAPEPKLSSLDVALTKLRAIDRMMDRINRPIAPGLQMPQSFAGAVRAEQALSADRAFRQTAAISRSAITAKHADLLRKAAGKGLTAEAAARAAMHAELASEMGKLLSGTTAGDPVYRARLAESAATSAARSA